MSGMVVASLGLVAMLVAIALRMPVALAMLLTGAIGYGALAGLGPLLAYFKATPLQLFANYTFSVVPLFLLMGNFAAKAGLSEKLFAAARAWLGHYRGGLAMATIGGCAGFGTICGSSLATAATMSQVALPELRRHGYAPALATGSLAAGGALGILIPPSLVLVIYALLAEQNIAKLFFAAFIPGFLAALGYIGAILVTVRRDPAAGPALPRASWAERWRSLGAIWPVAAIFLLVIFGINFGWFTPTEGAAVGAAAAGAVAFVSGRLDRKALADALLDTAASTGMIFAIILGADMLKAFLGLTQMPQILAETIGDNLSPYLVLAAMLAIYLLLGSIMDSLSMILLTLPIFFPTIAGLDFGMTPEETAIWFGILVLITVEVGLISPPVGLNLFLMKGLAKDVPMSTIYRGVMPFLYSDILRILLIVAVPEIALIALRWL